MLVSHILIGITEASLLFTSLIDSLLVIHRQILFGNRLGILTTIGILFLRSSKVSCRFDGFLGC